MPTFSRPSPAVLGTEPTVISAWLPSTVRPSAMFTTHAVVGPRVTDSARGVLDQCHAALGEGLLQHGGGVGVLVRQDLVAAGHDGDLDAELGVGVAELGAGDAGPDDDQVLGQFGEVVELAPVQDALAVGHRVGQHARAGAGGDQHHVGLQHADLAVRCGDLHPVVRHAGHVVDEFATAGDDVDVLAQQLAADVGRLRPGQRLDPVVDLLERDLGVLDARCRSPDRRRGAVRCARRWRR